MRNIALLRRQKQEVVDEARALVDAADRDGRKLTTLEENKYDALIKKADAMEADILNEEVSQEQQMRAAVSLDGHPGEVRSFGAENLGELRSHLSGGHDNRGVTFGDFVQAIITGKGKPEARQMIVATGEAGGYMVPEQLFSELFAEAMGQARVIQAGSRIIKMDYMTMRLPKVVGYPSHQWLDELEPAEPSVFTFDKLDLKAEKCSIQCDMSIELAEDAAQFAEEINAHMRAAIALAVDHASLNGAVGGPGGLLNDPDVQRLADVGALESYSPFSQAWGLCESANYSPRALLMHPWGFATLDALTAAPDGQSLRPPESFSSYRKLTTTQLELEPEGEGVATSAILGDWRQFIWAIRTDARLEISRCSVDAWRQYGHNLRVYWRGNCAAVHPRAFVVIPGIELPALPSDYENGS